jgi:hypothetical protein
MIMLAHLEQQTMPLPDAVDLLRESHANVRRFLDLGSRMAVQPSVFEAEVRALAGVIHRYSVVGLRLIISDEEALMPYLAGRNAKLDRTMARMRMNHLEYENHIRGLEALAISIDREAFLASGRGRELGEAITAMAALLEPHLLLVEREIFSALEGLAQNQRDSIRAALDALRDRAMRSDW